MASAESGGDPDPGKKTTSVLKIRIPNVRSNTARARTPAGIMNTEAGPPAVATQPAARLEPPIVELPSDTDSVESVQVVVAKRGRGRPKKIKSTDVLPESPEFTPDEPRKRRGEELEDRPPKARRLVALGSLNSTIEEPKIIYTTQGYVCTPPAPVSGRGKSIKPVEAPLLGPFPFTNNTTWMELISNVAKVLECHPDQAATSTMFWKPLKPKNSLYRQVSDEVGFAALHEQLLNKKTDKEFIVKITRAEHAPVNATMAGRSAAFPSDTSGSSGGLLQQGSTIFDKTYDQKLFAIEAELKAEYAVGCCELHPDIQCFHHKPSNLHWELTPARLSLWAAHINRRQVDKFTVPASRQFTKETSIGWVVTTAPPPIIPTQESLAPSETPMMQMMAMTLAMLTRNLTSTQPPSPPRHQGPASTTTLRREVPSSPPPPYEGPLETWGAENNLSAETIAALDSFGFQPGDQLEEYVKANPVEVKEAGIKPMELQRAIRANKLYHQRAKARRAAEAAQNRNE